MAWDGSKVFVPGVVAAADYSAAANQYKAVKLTAKGEVTLCTAITDKVIGILQNRPAAGETAEVVCFGFTKWRGNADLSVGTYVSTSTDGEAQAAVSTQFPCGHVVEDNAAAGGYATVFVNCAGATVVA